MAPVVFYFPFLFLFKKNIITQAALGDLQKLSRGERPAYILSWGWRPTKGKAKGKNLHGKGKLGPYGKGKGNRPY